ncbi:unnamed protein product [Oikopleura dioica]|uniref:C-type lectin domain-containing protein n=1 Tax=Oikopleura dioica TaxID=34765 RepID=E4XZS6_OIKDI|nr:unnamed protein product [Oikopleura dioica]
MCLFNSCIQDDYACGPINNFARNCLWNKIPGGPDYNRICTWPQVTGCTEECSGGQVYKGCTNNCLEQRTCDDVANGVSNADRCGTGRAIYAMCGCPDGQVMHNGECINEAACPRDCDETDVAFCQAWGDPHYTTFDGEYHHFQGTCKYTFVESAGDDEFRNVPAFKIDVDQRNCGFAVTCIRGMTFEFPGKEQEQNETPRYLFTGDGEKNVYIFEDRKTGEIYYNNFANGDVDFELISYKYNINTWFGAKVEFNDYSIKVTLPKCYMNHVIGLCGNWNGVTYDQFVKLSDDPMGKWREHQEGLQAWANDFGEPDPRCREVHDFECDDIDAVSDMCLSLDPNNVDENSYFFHCSPYVDKTAVHIACLIDGCTDRSSLCGSLGSYAKQCLNSIPISLRPNVCSWATESGCEQECGANSVFEGCASTCQAKKTCRNRHMSNSERCGADINEIDSMCVCEPGYVLDNGNCIREEDCGCVWDFNGIYYSQGTSFANEDETCECTAEGVVCTPIPCETSGWAYCRSHNDPYIKTFDGYTYGFHGNCRYNLASAPDREDVSGFNLDSKNRKPYLPFRGTVTDELWFDFHGSNYVFGDEKRFSFHVRNLDDSEYYNNARFEVTFIDNQTGERIFDAVSTISSNIYLSTEDYRVSLYQSDGDIYNVRVITSNNVYFYFSRYYWSAKLWVNRCYKNVMTGLCGNYNNNDSEERILRTEYIDDSEDFGDRFQTDDDDTCAHGQRLRPCEDLSLAAYKAAADRCDIVDQNPRISENQNFFRGCEFLGNRSPFYEACLFNSCLERDLHCGIIGDYASQCLSRKVPGSADYERICDWASKTGCEEECPASQGSTTLIGSTPIAPAVDTLIGEITSSAYSSFEVSIFCASDSLPFDGGMFGFKSILHVSSGTDYGEVGSRVFTFWRNSNSNAIYIATPIGTGRGYIKLHTCEANTYSTYKMVVSPDENDSSQSVVELFVDGESVATKTGDKTQLVGDGVELQVWAGNGWPDNPGSGYGTGTTYLIKDLIYNGNIRQVFKGCTTACFEQQTCEDVARGLSKEDRCADSGELVEGMCGCPDGHVLDEGVCVSESSCGCINEAGEYAAVGSKQYVGREECTCTEGGEYDCVQIDCPCDAFDEACIDFVCEKPRNHDDGEAGFVGKFYPPQEYEIGYEWTCHESFTETDFTERYVLGPMIIDMERARSGIRPSPEEIEEKKKGKRRGRSDGISLYWFAYAGYSTYAGLAYSTGGSGWSWNRFTEAECNPGFNYMKLTQVFDSDTNKYIKKAFFNNVEFSSYEIDYDDYFQIETELGAYLGSPLSDGANGGLAGQIRNFYIRNLTKEKFTALLGVAQNAYSAELRCRKLGGHLAFFRNKQDYRVYLETVGDFDRENWIGAQRVGLSDRFVNIDGTEAYLPWSSGEPNNANAGDENCVEAWRNGDGVNDQNCYSGGRQYSCRFDTPPTCADIEPNCSSDCSSGFNRLFCPLTCGTCDTWAPQTIGDISFLDNWNAENCKDTQAACETWANRNQCIVNPSYMLRNCPVSCKQCTPVYRSEEPYKITLEVSCDGVRAPEQFGLASYSRPTSGANNNHYYFAVGGIENKPFLLFWMENPDFESNTGYELLDDVGGTQWWQTTRNPAYLFRCELNGETTWNSIELVQIFDQTINKWTKTLTINGQDRYRITTDEPNEGIVTESNTVPGRPESPGRMRNLKFTQLSWLNN